MAQDSFVRRHRKALSAVAVAATAVMIFLAGMGTATFLVMDRITSMAGSLPLGGLPGGGLPGGASPQLGPQTPGDSGVDLQGWADEQGLPKGLPEQILQMLYDQYPDGVPQETKDQLKDQFGG